MNDSYDHDNFADSVEFDPNNLEGEIRQLRQTVASMERRTKPITDAWYAGSILFKIFVWVGGFLAGGAVIWTTFGDFIRAHIK